MLRSTAQQPDVGGSITIEELKESVTYLFHFSRHTDSLDGFHSKMDMESYLVFLASAEKQGKNTVSFQEVSNLFKEFKDKDNEIIKRVLHKRELKKNPQSSYQLRIDENNIDQAVQYMTILQMMDAHMTISELKKALRDLSRFSSYENSKKASMDKFLKNKGRNTAVAFMDLKEHCSMGFFESLLEDVLTNRLKKQAKTQSSALFSKKRDTGHTLKKKNKRRREENIEYQEQQQDYKNMENETKNFHTHIGDQTAQQQGLFRQQKRFPLSSSQTDLLSMSNLQRLIDTISEGSSNSSRSQLNNNYDKCRRDLLGLVVEEMNKLSLSESKEESQLSLYSSNTQKTKHKEKILQTKKTILKLAIKCLNNGKDPITYVMQKIDSICMGYKLSNNNEGTDSELNNEINEFIKSLGESLQARATLSFVMSSLKPVENNSSSSIVNFK